MVTCQETPPLKGSKHSWQCHPHDAALVNALSFVSMGVEARCRPSKSAAHLHRMKRQPFLCNGCPCHGRCHCHHHCHLHCRCRLHRRCIYRCRCNCPPLPLRSLSTIAAAISGALPSAIAVANALAAVHCRLCHRWPSQLPSPLAITIAMPSATWQKLYSTN
jgi:hypothetical protein